MYEFATHAYGITQIRKCTRVKMGREDLAFEK